MVRNRPCWAGRITLRWVGNRGSQTSCCWLPCWNRWSWLTTLLALTLISVLSMRRWSRRGDEAVGAPPPPLWKGADELCGRQRVGVNSAQVGELLWRNHQPRGSDERRPTLAVSSDAGSEAGEPPTLDDSDEVFLPLRQMGMAPSSSASHTSSTSSSTSCDDSPTLRL